MVKRILMAISLMLVANMIFAEPSKHIPMVFSYQGVLLDDGGNPFPDSVSNLKFRIVNSAGTVLYEESQDVEVVKGQASAIIGNGLDPSTGSPTGGIPSSAFDPTDTHYLQVEVEGQKPYDNLEIVAQPYSLWANTALGLAEGALTGEMVGEKAIEKKHLSDELMSDLKAEFEDMMSKNSLSQTGFKEFKNTVQGVSGAAQVGVVNNLIYSGSQTVQGVLSDLDLAIKKRQEEVDFSKRDYQTKVDAETNARVVADNAEMQSRAGADATLQNNINSEAAARSDKDSSLQNQLDSHSGSTSAHGSNGTVVGLNTLNSGLAGKINKSGDTMNGSLVINGSLTANLYGSSLWTAAGNADDNTYTASIPSNLYDATCGVTVGLAAFEIEDGIDILCIKACRDSQNRRFRIRCLASTESGDFTGVNACSNFFASSHLYENNVSACDEKPDAPGAESCRVSYREVCYK